MIPRPPNLSDIRLFRLPRRRVLGSRPGSSKIDGIWWSVGPKCVVVEGVENGFADATHAYYAGDYERTLELLDGIKPLVPDTKAGRADISLARIETLIVMGRIREGCDELVAFLSTPPSVAQLLRRCWLYAARLELGEVEAAAEELAFLELDEHTDTLSDAICVLNVANFMAFLGEFERSERHLVRWASLPRSLVGEYGDHLEGFVGSAANLAAAGAGGANAGAWTEGLLARVRAAAVGGNELPNR